MGQSTRLYGANIDVFSIGGTDYVGRMQNVTINFEFDVQEAVALQDVWRYPRGIRMSWNVEGEMNVDTSSGVMTAAIAGLQVAVVLETGPSTTADRYSGAALLTRASHSLPDGPQVTTFTLQGQGALTRAASS